MSKLADTRLVRITAWLMVMQHVFLIRAKEGVLLSFALLKLIGARLRPCAGGSHVWKLAQENPSSLFAFLLPRPPEAAEGAEKRGLFWGMVVVKPVTTGASPDGDAICAFCQNPH